MTAFICTTCGTQFEPADAPPERCAICCEERQFVNPAGQAWTTLDDLRNHHFSALRELEPGLTGIGIEPKFGIGQRALLLRTPHGNLLWDCISLLDPAVIGLVRLQGGLAGIAISHPHYYTTMVEWARAFDCPVHLHAADRQWVMRSDARVRFWEGATQALLPGVTLIHGGGHFAGGTMLHWRDGAEGKGALLSGDIVQVTPDRRASFMWSYPNYLPLSRRAVERIMAALAPLRFDAVYGAFWPSLIPRDGSAVVVASAARYLRCLEGAGG
jgi:glyoxylase-like metal-dependent hydrolase (beta-lactamase superfamily II)